MSSNPAARLVAGLLGAFALLVAGFYLGRGTQPQAARNTAPAPARNGPVEVNRTPAVKQSPPTPAPADPHAGHAHADGEHHHFPPEIPRNEAAPPAGSPLADPSRTRDLPGLLAGLRHAVAEADPNLMTAYQNAILTFMRGDEARALQVIEAFRNEESATVLDVLASAIASDPSFASNPRLAEQFLSLAESANENEARRQTALFFLSQTHAMPPLLQDRVAALARVEADPVVQSAAVQALAHFAGTDESRTATVNVQLVDIARSATDPMIRSGALAGVFSRAADENLIATVGEFLRADRDAEVRRSAAESLGGVPAPNRFVALAELEKAYRSEGAEEVRRTILISVLRAGRGDAAATLERLLPADAGLAPDVRDYLEILKTGETDINRIFEEKTRRDLAR